MLNNCIINISDEFLLKRKTFLQQVADIFLGLPVKRQVPL